MAPRRMPQGCTAPRTRPLLGEATKRATIASDIFVENALSPECKTAARAAASLLLLCTLAGCGLFKTNETTQAVISQRLVGMPVGDFFQQYGPWKIRNELVDGTIDYSWVSAIGATPNSGYYGLDDRTCTLHIVAARNGRIAVADVLQDNVGRTSTSRCVEMFTAK